MKKFISLLLTFCIVFSTIAFTGVGVFADDNIITLELVADRSIIKKGDSVTVSLTARAEETVDIFMAGTTIVYDKEMFCVADDVSYGAFDPNLSDVDRDKGEVVLSSMGFNKTITENPDEVVSITFIALEETGVADFKLTFYEGCWSDLNWNVYDINPVDVQVEVAEDISLSLVTDKKVLKNGESFTVTLNTKSVEDENVTIAGACISYDKDMLKAEDTTDFGCFDPNLSAIDNDKGKIVLGTLNYNGVVTPVAEESASFTFTVIGDAGSTELKLTDFESCWADAGMNVFGVSALSTEIDITEQWIAMSAEGEDISPVEYGTEKEDVIQTLPDEVTVRNIDGSKTENADVVDWKCEDYDRYTAGDYTFTGKVAAGEYGLAEVKDELTASVVVTVNKGILAAEMIENELIGKIFHSNTPATGEEVAATLPKKAVLKGGELDIVWSVPPAADVSVVGTEITVTGTITGAGNYEGTITVTGKVTVENRTYQCIFKNEDGTIIKQETLTPGALIVLPESPVKEGNAQYTYVFAGWDGYIDGMTVSDDVTFTAKYDAVVNQYTYTFVSEGETVAEATVDYGTVIPLPENPSKEGNVQYSYNFAEWVGYTEGMVLTEDATFTARYDSVVNKYTYKFISEGETVAEATVDYGTVITLPETPVKPYTTSVVYVFEKWEGYTDGMTVAGDVEFTAKYTSVEYVLGDINKDGLYNVADGLLAIRMGLSTSHPNFYQATYVERVAADVNGDGSYNVADALLMIRRGLPRILPGAISKFPIEE